MRIPIINSIVFTGTQPSKSHNWRSKRDSCMVDVIYLLSVDDYPNELVISSSCSLDGWISLSSLLPIHNRYIHSTVPILPFIRVNCLLFSWLVSPYDSISLYCPQPLLFFLGISSLSSIDNLFFSRSAILHFLNVTKQILVLYRDLYFVCSSIDFLQIIC